jgi:hypothetical protein
MSDRTQEERLTPQQVHETLYDGLDVTVRHKDGRSEAVKVRKIPRSEFHAYSEIVARMEPDESAECAYYVGRDPQWSGSLHDESFDLIMSEGQRLNFPSFAAWFRRQAAKLELVRNRNDLVEQSMRLLETSPTLSRLLERTNGSSARDTATPTSGATRKTS